MKISDATSRRTRDVLAEVGAERVLQDLKWGGPTHDDIHSEADWNRYVREHEVRAARALVGEPIRASDEWRRQMVRVAALAVAAIESHDRRRRARHLAIVTTSSEKEQPSEPTYWDGELCEAHRVRITVGNSGRFRAPWFAGLVGQERDAVEVTYAGQTFYLDDAKGEGWHKVTVGMGSLSWSHGLLDVQEGTDVALR